MMSSVVVSVIKLAFLLASLCMALSSASHHPRIWNLGLSMMNHCALALPQVATCAPPGPSTCSPHAFEQRESPDSL